MDVSLRFLEKRVGPAVDVGGSQLFHAAILQLL
jgi:hypothetical protein